ncbi:MAG: rRNA maturation RNase YbeY, partial [Candidatus Omnitrophica bacterium CG1_02_46_14]
DTATDVIAFWFEGTPLTEKERNFLGDIVASVETAKRVAKEMKITFKEELARYLVHGTLHLLGYDDKKPKNKKVMHCRQEWIVDQLCTEEEHSSKA